MKNIAFLLIFIPTALAAQNNTRPNVFLPAATDMQVNSYSGGLYAERQDLFIPGRGLDIDFTFSYNSSFDTTDWGYGYGWTHTYNMHYIRVADTVTVVKGDGRRDVFVKNGGVYTAPVGVFDKLEEYEPGKLRLTEKFGMRYFFDDAGNPKLTKLEDRNGNAMTLNWSGNQLAMLTDASGRQISLSWSDGHLTGITDALDTPTRNWTYAYDQGLLVSVTNPLGGQRLYVYDEARRLIRTTDENNNETVVEYAAGGAVKAVATCLTRHSFTYDLSNGKSTVTEIVASGNQTTTYAFDSLGRNIARKGNCCGFETNFQYDANNNITQSVDANGNSGTYVYDANGNATTVSDAESCTVQMAFEPVFNQNTGFTDKNGNATGFSYDNKGNLTGITRPLGVSESYSYDAFGNQLSFTDARGNTTTYEYNTNGYLTQINHPIANLNTQFTYDNRGNKLSQTDGNGHATQFTYDALNRLVETEDPLGNTTLYEYDARGNQTKVTNALGHATEYFYDPLDRLIEIKAPLGVTTKYTYDSRGNRLSETDQRGATTTYSYDSRNFLVAQKDPLGHETAYAYDGLGNQIAMTDPNGNTTQYFYDKLNRLVKSRDPLGFETLNTYDCNGNVLSVTDANGNATSYAYDALNRQTAMTDALGFTTHFEYDKNNNLTKITDAKGNPTSYQYDALNRKTVETYADNTTKVFTYDGAGNVASRKDNAGNMTFYSYDANNRLTLRDYPDANDDHFSYDALDRMTEATNQNAVVTFSYDALDRMLGETLNGKTTGYAYNNATGKRTLIYPNGRVIEEYYDLRNQLTAIKESNETLASFAYDPAGRMTTRAYGNGTVTTYTYDADNRVTSIVANPGEFIHFTYAYDNVGNKLYEEKRHHPTHSEAYGYDANYRLTSFKVGTLSGNDVLAPLTQTAYNYDALGNRTTVVKDGVVTTYTVNEMNEYISINGQPIFYNQNGSIIEKDSVSYTYNFENRLIKAIKGNFEVVLKNDAINRRIKVNLGIELLSFYMNNNIIEDLFDNGTLIEYVHADNIDDIVFQKNNSIVYFRYLNSIKSTIGLSNNNGTIVERYEYDNFGFPSFFDDTYNNLQNSDLNNRFLFANREYCSLINIYHFRTREMNSDLGRFGQRDMLGYIDGMNQYIYAQNNPMSLIDPFGTQSCENNKNSDDNNCYPRDENFKKNAKNPFAACSTCYATYNRDIAAGFADEAEKNLPICLEKCQKNVDHLPRPSGFKPGLWSTCRNFFRYVFGI